MMTVESIGGFLFSNNFFAQKKKEEANFLIYVPILIETFSLQVVLFLSF
jgi:hypothetical protein